MTMIGLEINDCGILAAGSNPAGLLDLDEGAQESPGFALPRKKKLLVGKVAEHKAHLFPRQILNRFWDQLNTEPLEQYWSYAPLNHAEIAYHHLASIWRQLQHHGKEIIILVPSFYDRHHLGLILGMARELTMPVKGFVPLALAASPVVCPDKMLLYLDIHLHRIEIVYLEQGEHLTLRDSATTTGKGLLHLFRELADAIAQEFVRTTRFDPFHQAASEQKLYDRLPGVLSHFQHNSSMVFEIAGVRTPYSITLERDLIIRKAESVYGEILRLIKRMQNKRGKGQASVVLQISHRLARLPGCKEMLSGIKDADIIELDRGAAAFRVPEIWNQLATRSTHNGISFFTSRPWQHSSRIYDDRPSAQKAAATLPTHLLHRSIAYPITEKHLTIGLRRNNGETEVQIYGRSERIPDRHCTILLYGRKVVLNDYSTLGTFVDDARVNGSMTLKLGQIIRLGTNGEPLQLIACLKSDET